MTTRQVQDLLHYLGYELATDGIWGPETERTVKDFQAYYGLPATGQVDKATEKSLKDSVAYDKFKPPDRVPNLGTGWEKIKYFRPEEFTCKCGIYCNGFPVEVDIDMVEVIDKIREEIGKPIRINSGIRCKQHNANVGGVADSEHLDGNAADLQKPVGTTPQQMAAIAEKYLPVSGGIGIYSWGIHVDTRATKARWKG